MERLASPLWCGPRLRVVFAGEATSRTHYGTVGGAMESGEREAHRLLCAWGVPLIDDGKVGGLSVPQPPMKPS